MLSAEGGTSSAEALAKVDVKPEVKVEGNLGAQGNEGTQGTQAATQLPAETGVPDRSGVPSPTVGQSSAAASYAMETDAVSKQEPPPPLQPQQQAAGGAAITHGQQPAAAEAGGEKGDGNVIGNVGSSDPSAQGAAMEDSPHTASAPLCDSSKETGTPQEAQQQVPTPREPCQVQLPEPIEQLLRQHADFLETTGEWLPCYMICMVGDMHFHGSRFLCMAPCQLCAIPIVFLGIALSCCSGPL